MRSGSSPRVCRRRIRRSVSACSRRLSTRSPKPPGSRFTWMRGTPSGSQRRRWPSGCSRRESRTPTASRSTFRTTSAPKTTSPTATSSPRRPAESTSSSTRAATERANGRRPVVQPGRPGDRRRPYDHDRRSARRRLLLDQAARGVRRDLQWRSQGGRVLDGDGARDGETGEVVESPAVDGGNYAKMSVIGPLTKSLNAVQLFAP